MVYCAVLTVLVGYFLGNFNGAVCMSVLRGKGDVRSQGSGNAGLTNFIRSYGLRHAAAVIAVDVGKIVLACLVGGQLLAPYGYSREGMLLAGIAGSLGHDFPVLLGMRGGKGILCGIAVAAVVDWRMAVIIFTVFLVGFLATGYVSVGSILGAVTYIVCFCAFYWGQWFLAAGGAFLGILAIVMHRGNISRLLHGTEKRTLYGRKKP